MAEQQPDQMKSSKKRDWDSTFDASSPTALAEPPTHKRHNNASSPQIKPIVEAESPKQPPGGENLDEELLLLATPLSYDSAPSEQDSPEEESPSPGIVKLSQPDEQIPNKDCKRPPWLRTFEKFRLRCLCPSDTESNASEDPDEKQWTDGLNGWNTKEKAMLRSGENRSRHWVHLISLEMSDQYARGRRLWDWV